MGGRFVTRLATEIPNKVIGLAYIAPGAKEDDLKALPKHLIEKPCYCIWANNDGVIKQNFPLYESFFNNEKKRVFVDAGEIVSAIKESQIQNSHMPELQKQTLFEETFSKYIDLLFITSKL